MKSCSLVQQFLYLYPLFFFFFFYFLSPARWQEVASCIWTCNVQSNQTMQFITNTRICEAPVVTWEWERIKLLFEHLKGSYRIKKNWELLDSLNLVSTWTWRMVICMPDVKNCDNLKVLYRLFYCSCFIRILWSFQYYKGLDDLGKI